MNSNLIYELEKEYEHFKLWKVYVMRSAQKVFLYKTTTHKAEDNPNYRKYYNSQKKKEREFDDE